MMNNEESHKDSFFKSLRRKESSLESLIDKRYSDRMDLSQVGLHPGTQWKYPYSMVAMKMLLSTLNGGRIIPLYAFVQDKFQVQNQLDRALSLIEKQQKDLKESGVRVNELTVQLGHLRNVLENKVR